MLMINGCAQTPDSSLSAGLWSDYRHAYIRDDGRVVDNGQQGISHSEGQGYAMILAAAANDRQTFAQVWSWTRRHLQVRADALLAWKWDPQKGEVVDTNNATDADLLVAWALLRAARRWEVPAYRDEAMRIAQDIRSQLVIEASIGPILLPGAFGFIHDGVVTINPSYWIFPALTELDRQMRIERPEHSDLFPSVPFVPLNVGRVQGGESLPKCGQSLAFVGELATEAATDDRGPRGKMCETDTALRDVLMLPPFAAGAKHVHWALPEQFRVGFGNRNPGML